MGYYKKEIGALGEREAEKYLIQHHYKILEKNYRCKCGEIDIIAKDGEYIVFIEVKTRRDTRFGMPSEAVHYHKRRKIIQTAQQYLTWQNAYHANVRFDVVEVIAEIKDDKPLVKSRQLIKNAFQV